MTNEKVIEAAEKTILLTYRAAVQARPGPVNESLWSAWTKIAEMKTSLIEFLRDDRREKAMRHLGFMQGVAWALGCATVDDLKRINMPEGETFK